MNAKRYHKQMRNDQIQVGVKSLTFNEKGGQKVRGPQFTAIDDAMSVSAFNVYEKCNQASAIDFIDYLTAKLPFELCEIRICNGHECQAQFHWYVEDLGIRHA